jgi:adenine-specific DNA-methyltransferase
MTFAVPRANETVDKRQPLTSLREAVHNDIEGLLQILLAVCREGTLNRIIKCPNYPVKLETPDLNDRIRLFWDCISNDPFNCPTILAELYKSAVREERRKLLGQYFTSLPLARRAVVKLGPKRNDVIVDAGSGTAIFATEMLKKCEADSLAPTSLRYIGVESDYLLAFCSAVSLDIANAPPNWQILYDNFLRLKKKDLLEIGISDISGLISNPPFVRYHSISDRNELADLIVKNTNLDLSRLSGLHSFFLAQSSALVHKGRMILVLPPEMNRVKHGSTLLNKIGERFSLRISKPDKKTDLMLYSFRTKSAREAHMKKVRAKYEKSITLGSIAFVHRGISTGANDFFLLTDIIAKQLSIHFKYLERIIPPRIRLPDVITRGYWDSLKESGKSCWLLAIKTQNFNALPIELKRYIKHGESLGVHMTATCKDRYPWFSIDKPEQPPKLVFTYMSRDRPRFICNKAEAYIANNLLEVELKTGWLGIKDDEKVAELLNESLWNWIDHKNVGRRYSGGLVKFEPKDLEKLPVSETLVESVMPPLHNFMDLDRS